MPQHGGWTLLAEIVSVGTELLLGQIVDTNAAYLAQAQKLGSAHDAHHQIMECLGQMIWSSQRSGLPPDGAAYVECVKRR